jgi:hypothetical protein
MYTYKYPAFFRLLYRYGNIPANVLLIFYLWVSATGLDRHLLNLIPLVLLLIVLYLLNKHYILLYSTLPYKIETDEEKLVASDFLLSNKVIIIYFKNISALKGEIFDGRISGLMRIQDGPTRQEIGFFNKLSDVGKLQTEILSRVNKEIYDEVIERVGLKKKKK